MSKKCIVDKKSKMKAIFAPILVIFSVLVITEVFLFQSAFAAGGSVNSLNNCAWKLRAQADVSQTGQQLSAVGYNSGTWVNAVVPGTVFNSYVIAGLEQDPNYGNNIRNVNTATYERNYWYRTEFTVPANYTSGKVWLNFDGINRDADIYVNGTSVGSIHGYLQRGKIDVTSLVNIGGNNALAALLYVPVSPISNDAAPTFICSGGWDWMPRVPDLNMGIWDDVYLSNTGMVSIIDPWIRTDLPLPSTAQADLSIKVDLKNNSNSSQSGSLTGIINPGNISFTQTVTLNAGETKTINLNSSNFPQLTINNPQLWWPNGYGSPNLYSCNLKFQIGGVDSDFKDSKFGIKEYSYDTDGGVLHIWVNGVKVFLKGGNWGMPEYMLRCHGQEFDTKVRLHKEMNFNMIRNWTGETVDSEFYDACDKYGIMVWDDFCLNCYGSGWPRDNAVFDANAIEKIKRFRNHPSIALWCGENEGIPNPPLDDYLRSDVSTYDGNDRYYQSCSNAGNLSGSGPWTGKDSKAYFNETNAGLRSEIGTAVFTTFDSFKKFMPQANWWPRNDMWDKHFFGNSASNAGPDKYITDLNTRYGYATGIEDFCKEAQLLNIETNKAMYEGWLDHMWNNASGILTWMSQSAYPSLVWQTYDYYYDTTGAYWGVKNACEPVHVYWNSSTDWIRVANTSNTDYTNLTAEAWVYNLDGTQKYYNSAVVGSNSNTVANCFQMSFPNNLSATHFIKLRLKNGTNVISENFYWRGTTYLDYSALASMRQVNLTKTSTSTNVNGVYTINATITNPSSSGAVALAIRPKIVKASNGEQVLPLFMNDGYFSLIPGESKNISIQFDTALLGGDTPDLVVECWNGTSLHTNLALNKPVTALSTADWTVASSIVDGDNKTRWTSDYADPQWIYVDLGSSYLINEVKLSWETAYGKSYRIEVSNDKSNWNKIYETTTGTGGVNDLTGLSGTGRYVRMYGTQRGTTYGYSLYEFEVYGTSNNLALKKQPVVVSSVSDSLLPASNAVDGNTETRWSSSYSDPQWIYVDLGSSCAINEVKLVWETAYGKSYKIEVSEDASNWNKIYETTTGTGGVNDITGLNATGRYVRMYGTQRGTTFGYSLKEFEVYSTNRALNKPVTALSVADGTVTSSVVDGDTATRWSSSYSDPQWIYVDLGSSYAIKGAKLHWETAFGKSYQIQISNDASNWTTIYSTTAGTGGVDDITGLSGSGRYVRMYGTQRGTTYGYSLKEFEVYGN